MQSVQKRFVNILHKNLGKVTGSFLTLKLQLKSNLPPTCLTEIM